MSHEASNHKDHEEPEGMELPAAFTFFVPFVSFVVQVLVFPIP